MTNEILLAGKCGENLSFEINNIGVMTIRGSGEMYNYERNEFDCNTPWWEKRYGINKVCIEDGVETIGDYALCDFVDLRDVEISAPIKSVGKCAFSNTKKLTDVILPDGLNRIGDSAFEFSHIKSIYLPDSLQTIEHRAFSYCRELLRIDIPDSTTFMGHSIFNNCEKLEEATLSRNAKNLNFFLFDKCVSLRNIDIPEGVEKLDQACFGECTTLNRIRLPKSVNKISTKAFDGCPNAVLHVEDNSYALEFVRDHDRYRYEISSGPNKNCIKHFYKDKTLTIYGHDDMPDYEDDIYVPWSIHSCEAEKVIIEEGVASIGDNAFDYFGMTEIVIPDGVTYIGEYAFFMCDNLPCIKIPNTVKKIGNSAFAFCVMLADVYLPKSVEKIERYAFEECENVTLHVEAGSFAQKYAEENSIKYVIMDAD